MYTCDKIFQLLIGDGRVCDVTCHGICSSWRVVKSATSNSYWLSKRDRQFERDRENGFQQERLDRNKYRDCGELEEKRAAGILAARRRDSCILNVVAGLYREEGK